MATEMMAEVEVMAIELVMAAVVVSLASVTGDGMTRVNKRGSASPTCLDRACFPHRK